MIFSVPCRRMTSRPEALRRFELMVEEAARHAEEAKKNAGEAETSREECRHISQ